MVITDGVGDGQWLEGSFRGLLECCWFWVSQFGCGYMSMHSVCDNSCYTNTGIHIHTHKNTQKNRFKCILGICYWARKKSFLNAFKKLFWNICILMVLSLSRWWTILLSHSQTCPFGTEIQFNQFRVWRHDH